MTTRKPRKDKKPRRKCAWCPNPVKKFGAATCSFSCRSQLHHARRGAAAVKAQMDALRERRRAKRMARIIEWLREIVKLPVGKKTFTEAECAKIAYAAYTKGRHGHRWFFLNSRTGHGL